ncbi:MAG: hypothetical protein CMM49_07140 [Rhodospirillaceae bacterium]|nr:hypothetical protein [Rhodospirillaceae bacterium]
MLSSMKVKNTLNSVQLSILFTKFLVIFIFCSSGLSAAPVLTESNIDAGSDGVTVGSFDGGGNQLRNIGNLSDTSSPNRNFVSQTFRPSVTGTYIFGLAESNEDTVLILYENSFDPLDPSTNALIVNDDSNGLGAGGVVMGRCGNFARFCPLITANLEGGKTFQIVITSFSPARTVSDGARFYIFGEPVFVGSIQDDPVVVEAAEDITQAVDLDLRNVIQNFMKSGRNQIEGAVERHILRVDPEQAYYSDLKQPIVSNIDPKVYQTGFQQANVSNNGPKVHQTGFTQPNISNNKPKIFMVYDNSKLEFASKMINKEKILHDTDLIISQNLFWFDSDNGNLSKNANITIALERLLTERSTLGASLGFQYNTTIQKFPERGHNKHGSLSLGVYGLSSASQNLIFSWYSAFLFGKGELNSDTKPLQWKSNYDTEGFTSGISTTGKVLTKLRSKQEKISSVEIWPKINLSYGSVKTTNLYSRVTIGSISENIIVSSAPVRVMEASFSPDFKIKIGGGEPLLLGDVWTISPGGRCQIIDAVKTSNVCTSQLGIYLSSQHDGMKRAEIQIEKSRLGKGGSLWVGLMLPF